jgi:hypothetical protein
VSSALVVFDQRPPRGADPTALLPRMSTFTRPIVRALDPVRGPSSTCAPSLSSLSSTGNRGRDVRRRSVTMAISSPVSLLSTRVSPERGPDPICASFCVNASDRVAHRVMVRTCWASARCQLFDAHAYSRPVVDPSASVAPGKCIGGRLELCGVGRRDGAGDGPGVDHGGRVELYVSADEGMSESVSVGIVGGLTLWISKQGYPPWVFR